MANILPLHHEDDDQGVAPAPLLVSARLLAVLLGVGLRTLRAMDAGGRLPPPLRLSPGCVRWRLDELRAWLAAGAPDRERWIAIRDAHMTSR